MPARRSLGGDGLSDDVAVAFAPARTYAQLVDRQPAAGWWRALQRPALVLLLNGTALALAATSRVTLTLVLSAMLVASLTLVVQFSAAAFLAATRPTRRVTMAAAIDLLFTGHVPWSLWLLIVGAWAASDIPFGLTLMGLTMAIPLCWTFVILLAFCRAVLQASPRGAWVRTLAHQAIIWSFGIAFVAAISGGWFRLLDP